MIDIIVIGIIALGLCGAIYYNVKRKKSGQTGCSSCSGCTVSNCHPEK